MDTKNRMSPSLDIIDSVIVNPKTKSNNPTVKTLHKEIKKALKKEINDKIKSNDNINQLRSIYDILYMFNKNCPED